MICMKDSDFVRVVGDNERRKEGEAKTKQLFDMRRIN
jgi:hypothetical protein